MPGHRALPSFGRFNRRRKRVPSSPKSSALKSSRTGGLRIYTWRTGLDEYGRPVHGSLYRYPWSNGPKERLEVADYSFEEHSGKQIACYPPRAVMFDCI